MPRRLSRLPALPERLPSSARALRRAHHPSWLGCAACLCVLAGLQANASAAEQQGVSVEVVASPATVAVGDPLTVTVTYRWPHGWRVETATHEPSPANAFANEFVTSMPPPERTSTGEEERRVFTLTLIALHAGAWALPQPTMAVERAGDHREASASAVIVQVGTEAKPPDLPPPRPSWVRPPSAVASSSHAWIAYTAGIVAAAALFIALLWRKRISAPLPEPHEVFARECQAAAVAADGKESGALLSLALRRYVGALHGFDGPGSTTRETASQLRGRLPADEHRDLVRMLDQLDGLRWSPDDLPVRAVHPLVETARGWTAGVQRRRETEEHTRRESSAPAQPQQQGQR